MLAALFVYVNVHGAVFGLVHAVRSPDPMVAAYDVAGELDPDEDPADPANPDEQEDSPPPPPSGLDEDDVKHCSLVEWTTFVGADARQAALHDDELAHDHVHLDDLERPPRA